MSMDIPDKLTNHFNFLSEEHGHFASKGHLRQFKVLHR